MMMVMPLQLLVEDDYDDDDVISSFMSKMMMPFHISVVNDDIDDEKNFQ